MYSEETSFVAQSKTSIFTFHDLFQQKFSSVIVQNISLFETNYVDC